MTAQPIREVGDKYVLPTGEEDRSRLDLIHAVYGPISERALAAARIDEASRAADIGCGTGTVSRWMAASMASTGKVDGIDIAPEQIEVAKSTPSGPGAATISYAVGSAYEPGLPEAAFDVVFCRLVLCHLKEPEKAVAQMAALLRKGGRLVLVDMDLRDIFTMPACEHYPAFVREAVIPLQAAIGVDYSVGLRLHELMAEAGLVSDFVAADQPIFRTGPEKHLWEKTWRVAMPRAAGSGVIAIERAEALIAGMEAHTARPDVWMASAKMFAVVGTKAA